MPITGQFFQQDTATIGEYPAVDAFLSFKVKQLRLFFKMENILGGYGTPPYYQTFNAPTPEAQFRFGMRWQLLN
jgi:Putative porin